MKLFIDSINLDEIKEISELGSFDGVTTNPTFFRRGGTTNIVGTISKIKEIIDGEIHVEIIGNDSNEIVDNVISICKSENIVPKIPITLDGLRAVNKLSKMDYKTNVHLVFSLTQAVLAARAGATYICPLVGRLYDDCQDGMKLIREIVETFKRNEELSNTKVMVSSIRTAEQVRESILIGAEAITIPPMVIKDMLRHPLTEEGIKNFKHDLIYILKQ